MASFTDVENI